MMLMIDLLWPSNGRLEAPVPCRVPYMGGAEGTCYAVIHSITDYCDVRCGHDGQPYPGTRADLAGRPYRAARARRVEGDRADRPCLGGDPRLDRAGRDLSQSTDLSGRRDPDRIAPA